MSIQHLEAAAELDLHATSKLVLMALADDANKLTRITYPGQEKLILWSGAKPRRVQGIIQELIDARLLARLQSGQPGRKAEFLIFPTSEELENLEARRAAAKKAKASSIQPVDNSENVGALGCTHKNNGCNKSNNGCNPECTPPVRPPLTDLTPSSFSTEVTRAVDNSQADDREISHKNFPTPAAVFGTRTIDQVALASSIGHIFADTGVTDDELHTLAVRILAKAAGAVTNPTKYVVAAIRREPMLHQAAAIDMVATRHETGGNPF
ncbi:hypothetical protein [Agreia sp. COWG]|uniref:hypothetical protein n=1 Tax=Agreia sp. COWG TaxID=2773266 RepID=UPI0019271201|nr:hypothetical protein [Agreia sp. COWG]